MRRPLLALVVLLALVAGACSSGGGDDDSASTTTRPATPTRSDSFDEYAAAASQICYDANQGLRFGSSTRLTTYADNLIAAAEAGHSGIQELSLPEDDTTELQQNFVTPYLASTQAVIAAADQLRAAAATGSQNTWNEAFGPVFINGITSWSFTNWQWSRDNGLTDCTPDLAALLRQ